MPLLFRAATQVGLTSMKSFFDDFGNTASNGMGEIGSVISDGFGSFGGILQQIFGAWSGIFSQITSMAMELFQSVSFKNSLIYYSIQMINIFSGMFESMFSAVGRMSKVSQHQFNGMIGNTTKVFASVMKCKLTFGLFKNGVF